jgi:ComF family protein
LDPQAKGPEVCLDCRRLQRHAITWARAAGIYQGPLQRAIVGLKFAGKRSLAIPLAGLLAGTMQNGLCKDLSFDFACPVPLHPERLKERGFNQSELIARYFCERTGIILNTALLQRIRPTIPQVLLPPEHRSRNVRGAFDLSPDAKAAGARVLLIDDVYTTGSTLRECARVLRRGGGAAVCVLTIARPRPPWMPPDQPEE